MLILYLGSKSMEKRNIILILMGVSGAGKTTIGQALAEKNNWSFFDGDDFHPKANRLKMQNKIPLTDDRS